MFSFLYYLACLFVCLFVCLFLRLFLRLFGIFFCFDQFCFSLPFSELDYRIQQLEKDLYYYKKTSRELKKRLREKAAGPGTSVESDVVRASGNEMEAQWAQVSGTADDPSRTLVIEMARKKVQNNNSSCD